MYKLFIDESGKNTLKKIESYSPFFALSGIIIHENTTEFTRSRADQIKFKYWGHTKVVFHATDLRRLTGDFSIFKNSVKFTIDDFYNDFLDLINSANFKICWVGINKQKYIEQNPPVAYALSKMTNKGPKNNWNRVVLGVEKNFVKDFTYDILTTYLCYLRKKDFRGQVLIEAADEYQDLDIFTAYNKLLISGHLGLGMTPLTIREYLTSISFVTKKNHDIETQLADMAAYYFNLKERAKDGLYTIEPESYEQKIINALKEKIFLYKDAKSGFGGASYNRKA